MARTCCCMSPLRFLPPLPWIRLLRRRMGRRSSGRRLSNGSRSEGGVRIRCARSSKDLEAFILWSARAGGVLLHHPSPSPFAVAAVASAPSPRGSRLPLRAHSGTHDAAWGWEVGDGAQGRAVGGEQQADGG
uniref:Uncharacterized protein n=1 Tax=Oryza meridionalis TaxID=40149 RepID=A0A0E0E9J8_9ORYZ